MVKIFEGRGILYQNKPRSVLCVQTCLKKGIFFFLQDKEKTGLYEDFDSHPPGVVEENTL